MLRVLGPRAVLIAAISMVTPLSGVAQADGGGGSGGGNGKATTVRQTSAAKKCADPAKVNDAVLTVTDMPTGYGEFPVSNPAGSAIRLGGGQFSSSNLPGFPVLATVFHVYTQGTQSLVPGPHVADSVVILPTSKDAANVLRAFRSAAAMAATWDQQDPGPPAGTDSFTSSALSFPQIGDETLALRISAQFRDAQFGITRNEGTDDYVAWRTGPVVSLVVVGNADTLTFVNQAQRKVQAILGTCPKKGKKGKKGKK